MPCGRCSPHVLIAAFDGDEQSCLLEAREQRLGHAAPFGQLGERQGLGSRRSRHRRHQALVGGLELAGQEALDHGQVESSLLQLPDPAQPIQVCVSVPSDAAFAPGRFEQTFALVEADGVHRHPGRPGQLFDPVLHEYLL